MAKRKRRRDAPQARHRRKSGPSRHDQRARLVRRREDRKPTIRARVPLTGLFAQLADAMLKLLDARLAFRLPIVIAGALLAGGRRTASQWFRAAGVGDDWDRYYELLATLGREAGSLVIPLLGELVKKFNPGPEGSWRIALDDSPTRRFGPCVEGANVHHNPTPGPADGPWMYGHNWVCLALLLKHPLWGVIGLPLLSALYVRERDVEALNERYGWKFQTKHELAVKLVERVAGWLRSIGSTHRIVVVADGAYAAGPLVRPLLKAGMTVVSRLRRDARLFEVPTREPRRRGRPRVYGKNRFSLAHRAARHDGWETVEYNCRGATVSRRYKTFLATTKLTGGVVRVVLLEHADGKWAPYFSSDPEMPVVELLETIAARWAIEEAFHDLKEVWGAEQQQVQNVWSSIGCWNLNGWLYTLVELASWDQPAATLVDRSDRLWDNPDRRPSHADKRRAIVREMLGHEFLATLPATPEHDQIRTRLRDLFRLAW